MKNENGFGSIVCLDKSGKKRRKPWAVRITTGWADGKQQRKYLGYYTTQADALMALADYHKNGVNVDVTKMTLNDVYEQWMVRVEKKASENVLYMHKMAYQRFGILGKKQIKEIKTLHLQDWLDNIDLKPASKGKIRSTLSQLYDYAVTNDIVNKNYAKGLEINEKIEKTGAIFTKDEIAQLWKHSDEEAVQDVLILIYTGMRIGEMINLDVSTVNLESRYMIGGSKTEAGKDRIIPIHQCIVPFIEERLQRGKHLLYSRTNTKLSYPGAKSRFKKLMERFNMEHHLHDTRKTAVSIMHGAGIKMEVIRIIIGHSGKGVTEQVYLYKTAEELVSEIDKITV